MNSCGALKILQIHIIYIHIYICIICICLSKNVLHLHIYIYIYHAMCAVCMLIRSNKKQNKRYGTDSNRNPHFQRANSIVTVIVQLHNYQYFNSHNGEVTVLYVIFFDIGQNAVSFKTYLLLLIMYYVLIDYTNILFHLVQPLLMKISPLRFILSLAINLTSLCERNMSKP